MPDDQLATARGFDDRRRAIARLFGRERAPKFFASELVESHGYAAFAADEANQVVAVDEGVPGESPERRGDFKVLLEFARPNHFAGIAVEAKEVAFGAQSVDAVCIDQRRGAWAG